MTGMERGVNLSLFFLTQMEHFTTNFVFTGRKKSAKFFEELKTSKLGIKKSARREIDKSLKLKLI